MLAGGVLFEVKAGERGFRSIDLRPLGWQRLPAPASFDHDRVLPESEYAHYSVESKSPMAQGLGVSLPPITITQPRPMVLSFMVWSGTSEKVRTTLNLTFDAEPSTMTTTSP